MKLFADKKGLHFNSELLSQNASYLRDALVLAAVEEAPEPQHLLTIITDALHSNLSQAKENALVDPTPSK